MQFYLHDVQTTILEDEEEENVCVIIYLLSV